MTFLVKPEFQPKTTYLYRFAIAVGGLYPALFPHTISVRDFDILAVFKECTMPAHARRLIVISACLTLMWLASSLAAMAQGLLETQAFVGQPFGVGSVTLNLPAEMLPEPLGLEGVGLSEKTGRVFYPAMRTPVVANALKEFLNEDSPLTTGGPVREEVGGILRAVTDLSRLNQPPRTTLYFLFRGTGPLSLTIAARKSIPLVVQPRNNAAAHRRLLQAWWNDYAAPRRLLEQKPDFPPQVETYLVSTLARRLNLAIPPEKREESGYSQFERELGALAGSEGIRTAIEQERLLGSTAAAHPADRPLPAAVAVAPLEFPEPQAAPVRRALKARRARTRRTSRRSSPSRGACPRSSSTSASAASRTSSGSRTHSTRGAATCRTSSPCAA